ncbi:MAG: hypothetical protein P8Z49_06990 [Acidobacteriota bacterium]
MSREEVLGGSSPGRQARARLNVAFADLNLHRPQAALEDLKTFAGASHEGVPEAVVDYVKAVALVQLGRGVEAFPLLQSAAQGKNDSLDGCGSILIRPLANNLLEQLPPLPQPAPAAGEQH